MLKPLFGTSTTCFHTEHTMSVPKYCGCNLVVLDIVVLKPIFVLAPPAFAVIHMSVPKCCGYNLVVLDMVVLQKHY